MSVGSSRPHTVSTGCRALGLRYTTNQPGGGYGQAIRENEKGSLSLEGPIRSPAWFERENEPAVEAAALKALDFLNGAGSSCLGILSKSTEMSPASLRDRPGGADGVGGGAGTDTLQASRDEGGGIGSPPKGAERRRAVEKRLPPVSRCPSSLALAGRRRLTVMERPGSILRQGLPGQSNGHRAKSGLTVEALHKPGVLLDRSGRVQVVQQVRRNLVGLTAKLPRGVPHSPSVRGVGCNQKYSGCMRLPQAQQPPFLPPATTIPAPYPPYGE